MEFQKIPHERFNDVVKVLRTTFFADEPLNKAAGLCQDGASNPKLEQHCHDSLKDGLSVMAVDPIDGTIAGVCLNAILKRGDIEMAIQQLDNVADEKYKKIFQLLYSVNLRTNLFHIYPNVNCIFDIRILSVDGRYRGQGIAKQLIQFSEQIANEGKFQLMKTDATGIYSQQIMRSCGFHVYEEQYYDKHINDKNEIILNVDAPHIKLQLLYKQLKS